jgi:hypothetical protein
MRACGWSAFALMTAPADILPRGSMLLSPRSGRGKFLDEG